MEQRSGYSIVHRDQLERTGNWSLVRRSLGCQAFGVNLVEIPPGESIPEHDESGRKAMHAPDMVFENHTAGERAEGQAVREHMGRISAWPDIGFNTRRLYVRDDLVVQEWTASATHTQELRRGEIVAAPSGKRVEWEGLDVIPFADGLVKRKDVYSDSVSILRQVGLLD